MSRYPDTAGRVDHSDLLSRPPLSSTCAVPKCGRLVEYAGEVCAQCVAEVRADLDDWANRLTFINRLERQVTTLLYARPERLRELVEQLDQEIYNGHK